MDWWFVNWSQPIDVSLSFSLLRILSMLKLVPCYPDFFFYFPCIFDYRPEEAVLVSRYPSLCHFRFKLYTSCYARLILPIKNLGRWIGDCFEVIIVRILIIFILCLPDVVWLYCGGCGYIAASFFLELLLCVAWSYEIYTCLALIVCTVEIVKLL